MKKCAQWFLGVMAALYAVLAPAVAQAAIDVTAVTGEIEGNKESMISVGSAMLGLVVIAVLFVMVRRVMR